jgi:molybdopterin-guanine dinucleotide biosynthesis protein A
MNCYILIGGRSRRMGVSKTALFLDRVAAAAAPVFEEVVAVQRRGGEPAPSLRTIFEPAHDDEAAVFGVARALADATGRCFLLAVDYPLISVELLEYLARDGRVPVWNGRAQPLCAVWDCALLPRIEERIAAGIYDLHGLIEQEIIPEPELRARFPGEPLLNVNTPEELQEAERRHGQGFLPSR